MKEKYIFLIGLGVGIVFTTIVAFFSYNMTVSTKQKNEVSMPVQEMSTEITQTQQEPSTAITSEEISSLESMTMVTTQMELTTKAETKEIKAKSLIFTKLYSLSIL